MSLNVHKALIYLGFKQTYFIKRREFKVQTLHKAFYTHSKYWLFTVSSSIRSAKRTF